MTDSSKSLNAALRDHAEGKRRELGLPPSVDQLLAFQEEELAEVEAERVREHLAYNPACADLVLTYEEFKHRGPAPSGQFDEELLERRRDLFAELGIESKVAPKRPLFWNRPLHLSLREPVRWVFAAALIVAIGGLITSWVLALQVRQLAQPRINIVLSDLFPQVDQVRGEVTTIRTTKGTSHLVLILNLLEPGDYADWGVELRAQAAPDGPPRWGTQGLRPDERGAFHLEFPRGYLTPGDYVLEIFGLYEGGRTPLATYRLRIEAG